MKSLSVLLIALLVSSNVMAHERYREVRSHQDHSGRGILPFVVGAIVGGIIIHEIDREPRYVTVCEDTNLYDQFGNYIKTERRCHKEQVDE